MTARRGLGGALALVTGLAVSVGLALVLRSALRDPRPILVYDTGRLVSTVPTTAATVGAPATAPSAVDPGWVDRTATASGIPAAAVRAYATAAVRLGAEQ